MSKPVDNSPFGAATPHLPEPVFKDDKHHIRIYQGDCLEILAAVPEGSVDLIFADPPYFLSNDGITCHAGRMVSVNKGQWDRSRGPDANHDFNRAWLAACQRVLKPNGTIWVSGTAHVIHSVGFAMQQLGLKLLNDISWVKPNPPPNLSCRYFTHATETIIWAAKNRKSRHTFHYKLMKELAGGKQMKSVWQIYPPEPWEKRFGKHPTQKPVQEEDKSDIRGEEQAALGAGDAVAGAQHKRGGSGEADHPEKFEVAHRGRDGNGTNCRGQSKDAKQVEDVAADDVPDGNVGLAAQRRNNRCGQLRQRRADGHQRRGDDDFRDAEAARQAYSAGDEHVAAGDE